MRSKKSFWVIGFTVFLLSSCSNDNPLLIWLDPDLEFTFLNGEKRTLKTYHGQWLLINFWSVSCPPCFEEMPELEKIQRDFANKALSVIGVSMPYDRPDYLLAVHKKKHLSYSLSLDTLGKINSAFGKVEVIPNSFLINPDGDVVQQFTGIIHFDHFIPVFERLQKNYHARKI